MFRWAHFTRWQGAPFPAYLRKTDRLPQAESLGIACFSAAYLCVCLSLLVPGQYAAVWRSLTSARVSNRGHQAAELGCGRLRRCPVIRPATDRGMRDTPYDRRRTLTAAYRTGACLSLDDFPAVSSQRLLQSSFFLICAELISALSLFLRYRGGGKCSDKSGKQKRKKNLTAISASYDPSCVCSIVQFWWPPGFSGGRILTYFGFLVRAKSC